MSHDASLARGSNFQRSSMLVSVPQTVEADRPSDGSSQRSLDRTQSLDSFSEDYTLHAKLLNAYKQRFQKPKSRESIEN